MIEVKLYTKRLCGYCIAAKRLLDSKGVSYNEIPVDGDAKLFQQVKERSGQRTVPQIWIGENHVGGYTELVALERQNQLDALLQL